MAASFTGAREIMTSREQVSSHPPSGGIGDLAMLLATAGVAGMEQRTSDGRKTRVPASDWTWSRVVEAVNADLRPGAVCILKANSGSDMQSCIRGSGCPPVRCERNAGREGVVGDAGAGGAAGGAGAAGVGLARGRVTAERAGGCAAGERSGEVSGTTGNSGAVVTAAATGASGWVAVGVSPVALGGAPSSPKQTASSLSGQQ